MIESTIEKKVVLLGNSHVGKTSILNFQLGQTPKVNTVPTIGNNFQKLKIHIRNMTVSLHVWDTAGQELFRSLVPFYIKGADAAIVVFDITDQSSFDDLEKWYQIIQEHVTKKITLLIAGNKSDLASQQIVSDEVASNYANSINCGFIKTSAFSGAGIDELFNELGLILLSNIEEKSIEVPQIPVTYTQKERLCC